ncbi:TIGR02611 family protein [Streptomyces virginiae]|uniref:TIGR02611 family protein n=1 Tax=Streptomyces TaxID=1883 RepID=UPI000526E59F|nr:MULTISPECIES: TIGR02611 family protein [Streptomyces]MCX4720708.1 TIGR02611 family protein [Streptomyces virginiae]MCX5270301.1 TIGR02611 family protein [Streptomyces virginiae]MYV75934.1 TIGR02611 family protein [Streptomyces sp. SID1046]
MNTGSDRGTHGSAADDATTEAAAGSTAEAATEAAGAAEETPHVSKAPAFIKRNRSLHLSWQVGVFIVGLAVIGAGIAMLVLPGPGWVAIFAGLAIWATEFAWAHLVLRWTKRKVTEAAQKALDPKVRRRNIILTSVGLVIAGALIGFYLWKYGLVLPWSLKDQ